MDDPAPIASLAVATGPYQVRSLTPGRCGDGCPAVEVWSYAERFGRPGAGLGHGGVLRRAESGRYPYARLAYVEAPVAGRRCRAGNRVPPRGVARSGRTRPTRSSRWRRRVSGSGSRSLPPVPRTAGSSTGWRGTSRPSGGTPSGRPAAARRGDPALGGCARGLRAAPAARTHRRLGLLRRPHPIHHRPPEPIRVQVRFRGRDVRGGRTGPRPGSPAGLRPCAVSGSGWRPACCFWSPARAPSSRSAESSTSDGTRWWSSSGETARPGETSTRFRPPAGR